MTTYNVQAASRPAAVVMALTFMAAFWVPTLSSPSQAAAVQAAASVRGDAIVVGYVAPTLM